MGREVLRQERASGRLATTKQNPARRIAEGGEHYVELSEDGTRVIKHTKDGMFGLILDVDHSGKVYASIATASEYLDRIEAENKHFGTGYELEGSHRGESDREDGDKDGLTHSQPIFRTLPPNPEEIRRHLEGKGYRLVSNAVISEPTFHDVTYYHPEERRVVGDAKPDNFCRLSKDKLQALDLIVHDAPEDSDLHRVLSANLEPPLPPLKP